MLAAGGGSNIVEGVRRREGQGRRDHSRSQGNEKVGVEERHIGMVGEGSIEIEEQDRGESGWLLPNWRRYCTRDGIEGGPRAS